MYMPLSNLFEIRCTTCSYSSTAVGKILTDSASRGPSAVAELPVFICVLRVVVQSVDARWRGLPRLLPQLLQGDDLPRTDAQKRRVRRIRKGSSTAATFYPGRVAEASL